MKKDPYKKILVYIFSVIVLYLTYEHIVNLDAQDNKISYVCGEIEDIRMSYKSIEYKPSGNNLIDSMEEKKRIGYTDEVQERLHTLELVCKNGISE